MSTSSFLFAAAHILFLHGETRILGAAGLRIELGTHLLPNFSALGSETHCSNRVSDPE